MYVCMAPHPRKDMHVRKILGRSWRVSYVIWRYYWPSFSCRTCLLGGGEAEEGREGREQGEREMGESETGAVETERSHSYVNWLVRSTLSHHGLSHLNLQYKSIPRVSYGRDPLVSTRFSDLGGRRQQRWQKRCCENVPVICNKEWAILDKMIGGTDHKLLHVRWGNGLRTRPRRVLKSEFWVGHLRLFLPAYRR